MLHDKTVETITLDNPLNTFPIRSHLCKLKDVLDAQDASEPLHVMDQLLQVRRRLDNKEIAQFLQGQEIRRQGWLLETGDKVVVMVEVADQDEPALGRYDVGPQVLG